MSLRRATMLGRSLSLWLFAMQLQSDHDEIAAGLLPICS